MTGRWGAVAGTLMAIAGVVWALQGLNSPLAPRSFMTNDRSWVLYGALMASGGVWLALRSRRRG